MRAVLQRVTRAAVTVEDEVVGRIDRPGLVALVAATHDDGAEQVEAMARKIAELRILRDEKIVEKARTEAAPYLQKRLRELKDHPLVGEVRGLGMLGAIELVKDKATRSRYEGKGVGMICRTFCFDNGLIMRAVGDTMIIAPPLVISHAEIDELVEKARKCLDLTLEAIN